MIHLEKPIREVFSDICDDNLTNLEIDTFIKKTTDKFKLPKLKRLIFDFERFIQKERTDLLIYFEFLYGDRKKFAMNGKIQDEETLNDIVEEYKNKYKNAPEFVHSDYDSGPEGIIDFSPIMNEYSTADSPTGQSVEAVSIHSGIVSMAIHVAKPSPSKYTWSLWSFAPVIMSNWTLMRLNTKMFKRGVEKLKKSLISETSEVNEEAVFIEGLKIFLDSPTYHFNVKLHTLYKKLRKYGKRSQAVSEPSIFNLPNRPIREHSSHYCARTYRKKKGAKKFSEEEIAFVMEYANQHEHVDNLEELVVEMIRKDSDCPQRIKDKSDVRAEKNWIRFFDKMNKIDRKYSNLEL